VTRQSIDLPGLVFGTVGLAAYFLGSFVIEKANRIVPGLGLPWHAALAGLPTVRWSAGWVISLCVAALVARPWIRFLAAAAALCVLSGFLGASAAALTPPGDHVLRIAPGAGFWMPAAAAILLMVDAASKARLGPALRLLLLLLVVLTLRAALVGGLFDQVSVLREYAANSSRFAQECERHVLLVAGSLGAAILCALPVGVAGFLHPALGRAIRLVLSAVQTIPSIALYGVLMAPLAALAAAFPALSAIGISGIGYAPAMIALFLYALFPLVANTTMGLERVDAAVVDASRGMGMTDAQVLWQIRWPLALPTVLTGVRVVLVQNIGLAAVAALVGGGGLGTFIFQGIGQTAMDLVLLGALPTVAMALIAGVLLDAAVDGLHRRRVP
jgi:osmoprotectant transport system permease protein